MMYSKNFNKIKTKNLIIDNFKIRDTKNWFRIASTYEVARYLSGVYVSSLSESYQNILFYREENGKGDFYIAIRMQGSGNIIGTIIATRPILFSSYQNLEVAVLLDKNYRTKGYMTEAMEAFIQVAKDRGYKKLNLEIQKDNIPSIALAKHLNADYIGVSKRIEKEINIQEFEINFNK